MLFEKTMHWTFACDSSYDHITPPYLQPASRRAPTRRQDDPDREAFVEPGRSPCHGCRRSPCADLPAETRQPDGPLPGRRPLGRDRAHLQRAARQGARPAGAGREPRRGERRAGGAEGARGAGRRPLHLPGLAQRSDPVLAGQRLGQAQERGLPPRAPGGRCGHGVPDPQGPAGQQRRRADRAGEEDARSAAHLWQRRRGIALPPGDGRRAAAHRHQAPARAVQGQRAADAGHRRRPGRLRRARLQRGDGRAGRAGQAQGDRPARRAAFGSCSRTCPRSPKGRRSRALPIGPGAATWCPSPRPSLSCRSCTTPSPRCCRTRRCATQLAAQTQLAAPPMSLAEASKFFEGETARYRAIAKSINLQPQ